MNDKWIREQGFFATGSTWGHMAHANTDSAIDQLQILTDILRQMRLCFQPALQWHNVVLIFNTHFYLFSYFFQSQQQRVEIPFRKYMYVSSGAKVLACVRPITTSNPKKSKRKSPTKTLFQFCAENFFLCNLMLLLLWFQITFDVSESESTTDQRSARCYDPNHHRQSTVSLRALL